MWDFGDRIRRNILLNCDHGTMIVNRFDRNQHGVGQGQWLLDHGNTATVEAKTTHDCVNSVESPVIFDVGANIGTYATLVARALPRSKIYCFEPQRLVFQMLCGNIAINNYDNCYIYNMGLGRENARILLEEPDYNTQENYGSFSLVTDEIKTKSGRKSILDIMSLDSFMQYNQIDRLDFIKIDVEGMELDILLGAQQTLDKYKPTLLVEYRNDRKNIQNELAELLNSRYVCYIMHENILAVPRTRMDLLNIFGFSEHE